jgi:hypothetical protein
MAEKGNIGKMGTSVGAPLTTDRGNAHVHVVPNSKADLFEFQFVFYCIGKAVVMATSRW